MFNFTGAVDFTVNGIILDGGRKTDGTGRTCTSFGGIIYMSNASAKLTLNQAVLRNAATTGADGGAIYFYGTALEMENASITNCRAKTYGGGIYLAAGAFTMKDGASITGNTIDDTHAEYGAGVYMAAGNITVGGSATIYGNTTRETTEKVPGENDEPETTITVPGNASNLRLIGNANTSYITLSKSLTGHIGICNAGAEGNQFGVGVSEGLAGQENFTDDVKGMYGVLDLNKDKNGKNIYWKQDPICQVVIKDANGQDKILGQYSKWDAGVDAANAAEKSDDGIVHLQLLKDIPWSGTFRRINPTKNSKMVIESAPNAENKRYTLTASGGYANKLFVWNKDTLFTNIILDGGKDLNPNNYADLWRIGYVEGLNVTVTLGKDCIAQNAKSNANGGAFCVYGILAMEDNAIIQNCESGDKGGAVHLHPGNTKFICKDEAIIQGCSGKRGGAIYSESSDKNGITISDNCKIINNTTENSGGAFYTDTSGVHITVSGNAEVSGNHADKNGGAFFASARDVVITINGNAKMENNTTNQSGAAVFASGQDTSITIGGNALIQNNVSQDNGPTGTIAERKAKGGGAIFNLDAAVEVSGSPTVRNNTTIVDGSPVERNVVVPKETNTKGELVTHLTVTAPLTGGEIGIYCADELNTNGREIKTDGTWHVMDQFGITTNELSLNVAGLNHLTNDRTAEALSGVSGEASGTRLVGVPGTGNKVGWYYVCQIVKDGQFKKVYGSLEKAVEEVNDFGDGDLKIEMLIPTYQTFESSYVNKTDEATVVLTTQRGGTVSDLNNIPSEFYNSTSGYSYYDVDNVGRPAVIYRGFNNSSVLTLSKGTLTITDIILDGHSVAINAKDDRTYTASEEGGLIAANAGTLNLTTGAILRNSSGSWRGGAVKIGTDNSVASLVMDSNAQITNCSASHGGGIHVGQNGSSTVSISGTAKISQCTASNYGGGMFIHNSKAEISGNVEFGNCQAAERGGAINIGWGTQELEISDTVKIKGSSAQYGGGLNIEGNGPSKAEISDSVTFDNCVATVNGGAIHVENAAALNMTGGTIKDSNANRGGAIGSEGGIVSLKDIAIQNCKATKDGILSGGNVVNDTTLDSRGGGIFAAGTGSLTILEGTTIKSCEAAHDAGGIYSEVGTVSIAGTAQNKVKIESCVSQGAGGGVCLSNEIASVTVENCEIKSCNGNTGGGINAFVNTLSMTGVTLEDNTATWNGGGLFFNRPNGKAALNNCVITNNKATNEGAAVWLHSQGALNLNGGSITQNKCTGNNENCGAINVDGGANVSDVTAKINLSGNVTVYDNPAAGNNQKNVVLAYDTIDIINVAYTGLGSDSKIGVYVVGNDDQNSVFGKHGKKFKPFGTINEVGPNGNDPAAVSELPSIVDNLSHFYNDRNGLQGDKGPDIGNGPKATLIWSGGNPAYLKLDNKTSKDYVFRVYIDNGDNKLNIYKRGSDNQIAIKDVKQDERGKYYYDFPRGANSSETLYIPGASGLKYTVYLYQYNATTKVMGGRVDDLDSENIIADTDSVTFTKATHTFEGTLVTGPRYKVIYGAGESNYVEGTPRKLEGDEATNYKNTYINDSRSSYNVATSNSDTYINVHIIDDGQQVAFMKIDGYGNGLNGAQFMLYNNLDCTDQAPRVAPVSSANKKATVNGVEDNYDGVVLFDKVPAGVYFMKEKAPSAFVDGEKYVVVVGKDNMKVSALTGKVTFAETDTNKIQAALNAQNNANTSGESKNYAIFRIGTDDKAVAASDIVNYGLMNTSTNERKVILRKTDGAFSPLSGAQFTMYTSDWAPMEWDEDHLASSKDPSGVFFIGTLSYGTYYLKETMTPTGYDDNKDKYFKLEVKADSDGGVKVTGPFDENAVKLKRIVETAGSNSAGSDSSRDAPSSGDMWGAVSNVNIPAYTESRYTFVYDGKTYSGKYAFDWGNASQDGDNRPAAEVGTVVYYNGAFRILRASFENNFSNMNEIGNFSVELAP